MFIDEQIITSSDSEKQINMLTRDQSLLLDILKNINDPTIQKEYLEKILKSLNDKEENKKFPSTSKNTYDLTEILEKRKKDKGITIQDLQKDIKEIKLEIR